MWRTSRYTWGAIQTVGTNLLLGAVGLCTGVLSARLLSPSGRGELAAIQIWPHVIATCATIGFFDAVVYYGSRMRAQVATIAYSTTLLVAAIGTAIGCLAWPVIPLLLRSHSSDIVRLSQANLLFVYVFSLSGALISLLRARGEVAAWNASRMIIPGVWLLTLLGCLASDIRDAGVVATAYLIAALLTAGAMMLFAFRHVAVGAENDFSIWGRQLRFSAPLTFSTVPQLINVRLDQLVLTSMLSPSHIGYYAVGIAYAAALAPVSSGFAAVLFPHAASTDDPVERRRIFKRAVTVGAFSSGALCVFLYALAPVAVTSLFGAQYAAAEGLARMLLFAAFATALAELLQAGLKAYHLNHVILGAEVTGLAAGLVVIGPLISTYGGVGAALAALIARVITVVILAIAAMRHVNRSEIHA